MFPSVVLPLRFCFARIMRVKVKVASMCIGNEFRFGCFAFARFFVLVPIYIYIHIYIYMYCKCSLYILCYIISRLNMMIVISLY